MGYRFLDDYDPKEEQKKKQAGTKKASQPAGGSGKKQLPKATGTTAQTGKTAAQGSAAKPAAATAATKGTFLGGSAATPVQLPTPQPTAPKLTKATAAPIQKTAPVQQIKLPEIQAFGAGDYSAAGKKIGNAVDRMAKTAAAGGLGAAGSGTELAGQFHPTTGQQSMGQFSGFGDLGRAVRESREKGTDISESIRRQEQQRQVQQRLSQQKVYDAADRLAEKGRQYEQEAKEGLGTVGRFLVDMGVTGTQMAGDALMNLVLPGSGLAMMGMRSYGQAAGEARREGKTAGQQFLAGLKSAGIEMFTEKMFGAFAGIYGKAGADELVEKLVGKLTSNTTGQALLTWMINAAGEGVEEVTSDLMNPLADRLLRLDDGKGRIYSMDDLAQWGYDFLLGTAMGVLGGGTQLARGVRQGQAQTAEDAYYSDLRRSGLGSAAAAENARKASDAMGRIMPARDGLRMPQLTDEQGRTYEERVAAGLNRTAGSQDARLSNENGLAAYTPQEKINLSSGVKNKIVSTYQETVQFIKNALTNKNNVDRAYMGIVPESVAQRVAAETGIDISGFGVMMNGDDVRHILKGHGDSAAESLQGQVVITENEIAQIPQVIADPDRVYLSANSDGKGRQAIVFEKQFGDTYITIQGVANGKKLLQTDTLYIRKRRTRKAQDTMPDAAESAAPVINVRDELPLSSSFTDTTVPQGGTGVNTQGMQNGGEYAAEAQTPLRMPQLTDEQGRTYEERQAAEAPAPLRMPRLKNENGLISLTEQEKTNLSSGAKNKVISTFQETVEFVRNALANRSIVDRAYLGKVPESTAQMVLRETGMDIDGYNAIIPSGAVRHMFNHHGDPAAEAARGQVALSPEAVALIPKILSEPDKVTRSQKNDASGRTALIFEKTIGDRYITVQAVSDGTHSIQADTLYIRKRTPQDTVSNADNHSALNSNVRNVPPQESFIPATTVPQGGTGVNTQGMQNDGEYAVNTPLRMPQLTDEQGRTYEERAAASAQRVANLVADIDALREAVDNGLHSPRLTTYAQRQATRENAEKDSIRDRLRQMDAMNDAAAERAVERRLQQGKEMPEALKKLGVSPFGSEANYAGVDALAQGVRGNNSARKQMQKQMSKIPATEKERTFARRLADGTLDTADIPGTVNRETVEILADYYRTMDTAPETLLLQQRRAAIFEREEAKMEPLLGMDVAYDEGGLRTNPEGLRKPSGKIAKTTSTLRRNLQTPARICATEWGAEHGKKVYEALFYPVTENNGRQIDWVNSMLDKVRTFTDSEGNVRELNRKERALVQKIVEHRGAEKRVQDIQERYETARQNAESAESTKKEKKKNAKGITVEQYLSQQGLIKADMEKRLKELSLEYSRRRKNGELEDISRAEYIEAEGEPELAAYVKRKTEAKGELYTKVMTGEIKSQSVMSRIQQAINGSERVRSYLDRMGLDLREYENTYYSPEAIFERSTATDRESNEYRKAKREWEAAKEMKSFLNAADNVRNGASAADAAREFGIDPSYPEYQDLQNYQTYLEALGELNDSKSADSTVVNKAVETYSGLYKELYEGINSFLVAHGYQTIGFIEGYAPHMQPEAEKTAFSKALKLLGLDDTAMTLPTSISGKTADLKPYKQYNPFFQERHGVNTEYDIAKGFEDYVYYLGNIFYHTDDIMRIRTAEKYIRKTYSSEEASEQISWAENARNFSDEQIMDFLRMNGVIQKGTDLASSDAKGFLEEYIGKLYDQIGNVTRYSEMAKYLDNYANRLAGKQNMADRGAEAATGRGSLNWINTLTGKYGGAKLAFNVSSALNQTSQIPMVAAENGERATLHAIGDFFKKGRADFARESNFLKGKKGIDWLLGPETKWEKFKEKGFAMTEAVDSFTSYVAVRSKYLKEINAGKSHAEAMKLADEYGRNVMGSRARGEKPMLFDTKNPFWQIVTRFQLEALNSWEHVSRDMPNEARQMARERGKTYAAGVMGVRVAKYLAYAFLLNLGVGALSGGSPVPYDAIGSLLEAWGKSMGVSKLAIVDDVLQSIFDIRLFGTDDDDDEADRDWWAFLWSLLGDVANDVPIVGQAAALAGIGDQTLATTDLSKVGDFAKSVKNNGLFSADTLDKGLTAAGEFVYGGNQLRKTLQGGIAVGRGGVYAKGNLRYQVDQTPMNYVKGLLFGRSALDESQAYYAERTSDFSEKQTEAFRQMQDRGVSAKASYDLIQELRGIEKTEESTKAERQRDALRQSGVSGAGKWVTYYQTMASSKEVEAMDAVQYSSETDYGTVTSLLMDLKEQDKDVDKMRLIDRSRLTDSQKASLYKSLIAGDEDLEKIDALKEVGITGYQYLQYKIATSGMTKREEKLNAINTLDLTDDQKDALYYLNSYASSTHGKAPWVQGITAAGSADQLATLLAADEDDGDDIPKWRESLDTYLEHTGGNTAGSGTQLRSRYLRYLAERNGNKLYSTSESGTQLRSRYLRYLAAKWGK